MRLIDYDKYMRKWSPRSTVVLAVVDSIVTGFFLSATLFEFLRGVISGRGLHRWQWHWVVVLGHR